MRRTGNLLPRIADRENLRWAFVRAAKAKQDRSEVQVYRNNLDRNLYELQQDILSGTGQLGVSRQFTVFDPKLRLITAPVFRERVLHHAIMNVCEPVFERSLIDQTYACRVGKGRVKAVRSARRYASGHGWYLKLDIRRYFESIPHDRLIRSLGRRFKDKRLLQLLSRIIDAYRGGESQGLPIGALTSQHFANFYLDPLDRFVKEHLRATGYVRYMDDFAVWSDEPEALRDWQERIVRFVVDDLGLLIKQPMNLNRTVHGMNFLGCRVFPHRIILNRRSRSRFRRNLHLLESLYLQGIISESELQQRATSLIAFAQAGGIASSNFRRRVLGLMPVSGQEPS